MKKLTAFALFGAITLASSMSYAGYSGCNTCAPAPTCNTCAPAVASVCMEPVCQVCKCCPVIRGFWG
jgi:hypothetical protein